MQIHALDFEDFSEEKYALIGIHTPLENYKIAYLLNQQFKINLKKESYTLDIQKKECIVSFDVYSYENTTYDFHWYLIENSCSQENTTIAHNALFSSETKNYLIPEKKNIDFFLKISGDSPNKFIDKTVAEMNTIDQIMTSYAITPTTLKSKDFLIF